MHVRSIFFLLVFVPLMALSQNHLMISEVQVNPVGEQFIEIFNPLNSAVDLSNYYLADYNTYYRLVVGEYSTDAKSFLVRFPSGASIPASEVLVVARDGSTFSGTADFEIFPRSAAVPDMDSLYIGSDAQLETFDIVILFYWDGQSDLVQDVDYVMWGSFRARFVDKSGVSIDGPDADTVASTYLNDTPTNSQQRFLAVPGNGKSLERTNFFETGEVTTGGNGIAGHDETSEPISANFIEQTAPNPGIGPGPVGAPIISNVTQTPEHPTAADEVTVRAEIVDNGTVVSARLIWMVNSQSSDSTEMQPMGNDLFEGVIPAQAPGDQVSYFIRAVDNDQLVSVSDTFSYTVLDTAGGGPHLLISEIVVTPTAGEFIEIVNPTEQVIDLSNYYITDATFAGGGTYYYNIVTGANAGGGSFGDFHARFPAGATIAPGEFQVIAMNGSDFKSTYNVDPTYELWDTDPTIPDMREALPGSINNQGSLTNSGEVVILYYWDGQSDLVQDVDYVVWGDKEEAVDKTGVSIDGPDADNIPSTYLPDTPIAQQISVSSADPHGIGESIQRLSLQEVEEIQTGGNGITGHDETSENLATAFQVDVPNPGSGPSAAGAPVITNLTQSPEFPTASDPVTVTAEVTDDGTVVAVRLLYSLNSAPYDSVDMQNVAGDTYQGIIPAQPNGTSVEYFVKAVDDEGNVGQSGVRSYVVGTGLQIIPIAQIQANPSYVGQQVTIEGIVVLGAGITTTSWTDAYVQDSSNAGINIYRSGEVDPNLVRGNRVRITGTVDEFQGVTEIVNYTVTVLSTGNELPPPVVLNTGEANNVALEGTFVHVEGEITDMYTAGSGTNISVDDGSGACLVRVWNSTGVNLSAFQVGDTVVVRGPLDIYQGATQILLGYQEDIFKPGGPQAGDGSGFAILSADSLPTLVRDVDITLTLWGNETDTLRTVHIFPPVTWGWSGLVEDVSVSGRGFEGATVKVVQEVDAFRVEIADAHISAADTGQVTFKKMTTPEEPFISYFWVKTAVAGGVPQFIAENPFVVVGEDAPYQIYDLQFNSAYFRDPVTIRGAVTVGAGVLRTDRTSAYIQDNSGRGININMSQLDTTHYKRGYLVEVQGTVSEFRQTTQITPAAVTILDSAVTLPTPVFLSTRDAKHPRWDGTLIRVYGVVTDKYTTSTSPPYDYNVVVNDGSGGITLRIWGTTGIDVSFFDVNDAIFATGVGSVFIDSQGKANYQILPAYQDHLELDPTYQPSLANVSLEVPPHPFVPDRGETIAIRYNAGAVNNHVVLRIFDLGGRLVTTLLDENAQLVINTLTWDGRNQLKDLVPLGTYICHLEVVEPYTGKKKTKMAPIVVGTVLSK